MWCHLCKENFSDYEVFKCHILKKHRPTSDFYKEGTDSEASEEESGEKNYGAFDSDTDENKHEYSDEDYKKDSSDKYLDDNSSDSEEIIIPLSAGNNSSKKCAFQNQTSLKTTSKFKGNSSSVLSVDKEDQMVNSQSHSYVSQETKNSVTENQLGQQSMNASNPFTLNISQLNAQVGFDFTSENLLKWLAKHKKLCRNLKYPLSPEVFERIHIIHTELFNRYCMAPPREENGAVLKVYEELNTMINKHLKSVNDLL